MVGEALASLQRQTMTDFEVVVVDDGSTDGTADLVTATNDSRFVVERHAVNRGVVAALNTGLAIARSRYVARLDHDDLCEPDRLERQLAVLHSSSEIGLVITGARLMDRDGRVTGTILPPPDHPAVRLVLLFGNCITHSSTAFRRDLVVDLGGYDKEFTRAEDYEMWLRLTSITTVGVIQDPLVRYRTWDGNASTTRAAEMDARAHELATRACAAVAGVEPSTSVLDALAGRARLEPPKFEAVFATLDAAMAGVRRECDARRIGIDELRFADIGARLLRRSGVLGTRRPVVGNLARLVRQRPALARAAIRQFGAAARRRFQ
jgi:hypothetical protein